jgi:hypothetical protein
MIKIPSLRKRLQMIFLACPGNLSKDPGLNS